LHLALHLGFCHHPTLSNFGSCCPLHQEPGKSRTGLCLSNLSASCQSERPWRAASLKTLPGLDSAGLFGRFMPTYLSLKLDHIGHPPSNLCLCYLPHVSDLSNEVCAHRVRVDCYLFTEPSSCRCSFFDWATPVKVCSILICMLIDCLLHPFLGLIQKRVCVPHRMHVVNELKQQVVDVRLCILPILLTMCRLNDTGKELLHYFLDLFYVVLTYSL